MKRLCLRLLILVSLFALVLAGCNTTSPAPFTATGVADTVTAGTSFNVAADTPITTYTDVVSPASGTDTLLTVPADPDSEGVREVAVVSGRQGVGAVGSSSVVYVGLAFENIVDLGDNSKAVLLQTLLNY